MWTGSWNQLFPIGVQRPVWCGLAVATALQSDSAQQAARR
jgi:hypothetical protein